MSVNSFIVLQESSSGTLLSSYIFPAYNGIIVIMILHRNYYSFMVVYIWSTLESGINILVRLLIFEVLSRGYVLIKGGYVY